MNLPEMANCFPQSSHSLRSKLKLFTTVVAASFLGCGIAFAWHAIQHSMPFRTSEPHKWPDEGSLSFLLFVLKSDKKTASVNSWNRKDNRWKGVLFRFWKSRKTAFWTKNMAIVSFFTPFWTSIHMGLWCKGIEFVVQSQCLYTFKGHL